MNIVEIDNSLSVRVRNAALICTLLVVLLHVHSTFNTGSVAYYLDCVFGGFPGGRESLASIAVPFFFTVSGYFLSKHTREKGWWISACKKRVTTILIPYLFWGSVALLVSISVTIGANILSGRHVGSGLRLGRWLALSMGLNLLEYPMLGAMWYIRTLIIFVIISPLLSYVARSIIAIIALWILGFLVNGLSCESARFVFTRLIDLQGAAFFVMGFWLRAKGVNLIIRNNGLSLFICSLWIAIVVFINFCKMSFVIPLGYISIPLGAFAIINLVPSRKLPFVEYSFPIYCSHEVVRQFLDAISSRYSFVEAFINTLFGYFLCFLLMTCLSILVAYTMKRVFPSLALKAYGGR